MRQSAIAAVLLLVAIVVAWAMTARRRVETPAGPSSASADAELAMDPAELESETSRANDRVVELDRSRVLGRVVDGAGNALTGARVWLFALDGKWRDGVTPPTIRVRGGDVRAFEAKSGADGRFVIDAPAPTGRRLRIEIETADHRGHVVRDLAKKPPSSEPTLGAGENDLGELVVSLRGAVTGSVRSRTGPALATAGVLLASTTEGEFTRSCSSEEDGAFVLAAVPDGEYRLSAELPGFLRSETTLVLARGAIVADVEFVLAPVPTIAGVVVDEFGAPIPGCGVNASESKRRRARGHSVHSITGADGRFELELRSDAQHVLSAGQHGFSPLDEDALDSEPYPPGTRDARIVLRRLAECTLTVLDAYTRAPIELVQLDEAPPGWLAGRTPQYAWAWWTLRPPFPAEQGRISTFLRVPPQGVSVAAPDHAPRIVQLTSAPEQTILLEPLGAARGRIERGGLAVARTVVWARPKDGPFAASHVSGFDETKRLPYQRGAPFPEPHVVETDARGEFELYGLDAGRWELLVREVARPDVGSGEVVGGRAPRALEPLPSRRVVEVFAIDAGRTTELGAVELAGGTGSARLHFSGDDDVPLSLLTGGIEILLNGQELHPFARRPVEPSVYTLDDLAPGTLLVRFGSSHDRHGEPRTFTTEVVTGETTRLDIDLRKLDLCVLTVHVESRGEWKEASLDVITAEKHETVDSLRWWRQHPRRLTTLVRGGLRVYIEGESDPESEDADPPTTRTSVFTLPARGAFETTIVLP